MLSRTTKALTAGAFTAAALAVSAGPAVAEVVPHAQSSWTYDYHIYKNDGDAGGISMSVEADKSNGEGVLASFSAKGEHLFISDQHKNGRSAIAKLWVGGSGPAIFYATGDNSHKDFNLSYDENQTVNLEVCTSDSANAVCTYRVIGRS